MLTKILGFILQIFRSHGKVFKQWHDQMGVLKRILFGWRVDWVGPLDLIMERPIGQISHVTGLEVMVAALVEAVGIEEGRLSTGSTCSRRT